MRLLKRVLIVFAALIALAAGGMTISHRVETARAERFYVEHPMLRAMNETMPGNSKGWERFTPVLLERVPVGSTRAEAVRVLGKEGFACIPSSVPQPGSLGCWTLTRPSSVPRWHIQLEFDRDNKVTGGKVLMLKATS